jgi:hypothetical protein
MVPVREHSQTLPQASAHPPGVGRVGMVSGSARCCKSREALAAPPGDEQSGCGALAAGLGPMLALLSGSGAGLGAEKMRRDVRDVERRRAGVGG